MELLLNIIWLTLALPAIWVWRRETLHQGRPVCFGRFRGCLILGCTLMLLFPVVSATDDLHAMRPEVEESNRVVKAGDKSSSWVQGTGTAPAEVVRPSKFIPSHEVCGELSQLTVAVPEHIQFGTSSSRPPPFSFST